MCAVRVSAKAFCNHVKWGTNEKEKGGRVIGRAENNSNNNIIPIHHYILVYAELEESCGRQLYSFYYTHGAVYKGYTSGGGSRTECFNRPTVYIRAHLL